MELPLFFILEKIETGVITPKEKMHKNSYLQHLTIFLDDLIG